MAAAKKATTSRGTAARKAAPVERWSQHVNETSDAMDLKPDVFKQSDPAAIARSLKASAEHSDRRKAEPFRSAMSMLNFYINRAGHNLEPAQHRTLEKAKEVLRALYGRADGPVAGKRAAKKAVAKKAAGKKAPAKKAPAKKAPAKKAAAKKAVARKPAAARKTA